jgi:hypothetical protein
MTTDRDRAHQPPSALMSACEETTTDFDTPGYGSSAVVSISISAGRQAVRRKVNAERRAIGNFGEPTVEIFCECGRSHCADHLRIDLELFQAVLNTPGRYVITTHHDHDPTQRLISRHHGFLIVERTRPTNDPGR